MKSSKDTDHVRSPSVAGPNGFYPSDAIRLRNMVTEYIYKADNVCVKRPLGLVVPHAGYIYSGPVAGWAYRQIVDYNYDTIIILAPSHFESFPYASVMPEGAYQTPLGLVHVDEKLASSLCEAGGDSVRGSFRRHTESSMFTQEHSLEVQLPFLQVAVEEFLIVPVILGRNDWMLCRELGEALAAVIGGKNVLVIASSDLSHYHDYDTAYNLDGDVIERIEHLDAEGLAKGCKSGELQACGGASISALLIAAVNSFTPEVIILKHATSGDIPNGSKNQVVGYLAVALLDKNSEDDNAEIPDVMSDDVSIPVENQPSESTEESGSGLTLSIEEKRLLLDLARYAINKEILGEADENVNKKPIPPNLTEELGLFVTLTINDKLRGCIGHIIPTMPLWQLVKRIAVESAQFDPRFPPLSPQEVPKISLEITLLGRMIPIDNPQEVEPGKHGVRINLQGRQGLLLPQVASSRNWDRWQLLDAVCMKASLPMGSWRNTDAVIEIFTADCFSED